MISAKGKETKVFRHYFFTLLVGLLIMLFFYRRYQKKGLASSHCEPETAWFLSSSRPTRPVDVDLASLQERLDEIEELTHFAKELSERALYLIVKMARLLEKIILLGNVAPKLDWSTPVGGFKSYTGYHYDDVRTLFTLSILCCPYSFVFNILGTGISFERIIQS